MTALSELRDWIKESGATHVIVEGPNVKRRRLSAARAQVVVRGLGPTAVTVRPTEVIVTGYNPATLREQTICAVHTPEVRRETGHRDENGRPEYVFEAAS